MSFQVGIGSLSGTLYPSANYVLGWDQESSIRLTFLAVVRTDH